MSVLKFLGFCLMPILLVTTSAGLRTKPVSSEVPPEKALSTFQLPDGFQIELVASEPLLSDPVAMEIDEYGRMYVVEMHGYPLDKSGTGKVRLLADSDGDGKMDKTTVFAEGLVLPTGIMRWKKGIIVTDPPNVLYLEDSDGDGKSDIRDTLLTGFAMSNPQHNFNNPLLGIDNWIYLGHEPAVTAKVFQEEFGDRGGEIFYPQIKDGKKLPQNALGRGVRFKPGKQDLEILSSYTQFGHTFDTWGRYLLVSNANPGYHEVIASRYLNRNPNLLVSNVTQTISDHSSEVFPITKNPLHQLLTDVGVFTSACGITSYQGGLFPSPFDSVTFVAEPVSNIVHADIVRDKGASFTAGRLYKDKEFLASTDSWFRPVNMYVGPDGALYVVDYYRQIIEHPEWMADDVIKSGALYNGVDKGRIYRITPKGTGKAAWTAGLKLGDASDDELVKQLANPNIWWRKNAQRLLLDRKALNAVPALEQMAVNPSSPVGRLHALWTLEGMDKLNSKHIITSLDDKEAGVRENAVKLAELFLDSSPELVEKLLKLKNDGNAKVRFQLLCTLGFVNTPQAAQARQAILFKDLNDPWIQIAALSAANASDGALMDAVLKNYKSGVSAYASLAERLSTMTGASGDTIAIKNLVKNALAVQGVTNGKSDWQPAVLQGLAQSMNKPTNPAALGEMKTLLLQAALTNRSAALRESSLKLLKKTGLPQNTASKLAMQRSAKVAADPTAAPDRRTDAIQFLSLDNPSKYAQILKKLITPKEPKSIQLTALKTLSSIPDETVSNFLLEQWSSLTPELRDAAINTFMVNDKRIKLLLDGVESGKIQQETIGWPRSVGLMAQANEALRNRSRVLLTKKDDARGTVIKKYNDALTLTGNASSGKQVYQKNCSVCHQIGGSEGVSFGPDLGTIRNRRPESIVGDILDPNLSIADGYDIWIIELKSGESVQGLISAETPTAITMSNYGGHKTVIARKEIKSLKALGMSSMPAGLEAEIDQQAMADLLAYIKQPK
ncbi:PVC-type heme-binding CxxCH protein [Dyadobacter sp. LHD-138]|uniref:PVC-type heme-binding CxxCH protein n=1 Tax=Dyadobacter sp. LHD-138 TaxID=3071413 RepID=UPI0027DF904C|nr:PVC-type heme-binding CxxCH protein [Dyadobacter sp. LHD-138]MDQ6477060.1 c-type cytochrome [Dyadobacter sp. LHD-138]